MTGQIVKDNKKRGLRQTIASFSKFAKAAFFVVLAFFVIGACTIGGFDAPGKAYRAVPDTAESTDTVVFYLDYQDGKGLDEIWINIGSVYTEVGSDTTVTFNYASVPSTSASTIGWSSVNRIGSKTFGNIYSSGGKGITGANYNWVRFADLENAENKTTALSTSYRLIKMEAGAEMLVNEVVFVDAAGKIIPAYVTTEEAKAAYGSGWDSRPALGDAFRVNPKDAVNLLDSQHSVRKGDSTYSNFTQDEAYSLMQIDNIFLGRQFYEGSVYEIDADSGPLSSLFMSLGVLVFGKSPFGLRIVPLLFATALVALAYFFGKELFGSDAFGLLFAGLFAAGGIALTVGRLGLSFAMTAFCVLLSYYCMYKFCAKGISADHPVKTALTVLFSGIAFAFAFALDAKAVIAAAGVVVLFIVGAVRQHRAQAAEERALREEMSESNLKAPSEEVMKENIAVYEEQSSALAAQSAYKNKLAYLFFFASFVLATVIVTLLSSLASYFSYVKFYEANPEKPVLGIFTIVWYALRDCFTVSNVTSYTSANASNAFGWLIGLKGATLFSATEGSGYLALNAQMNTAVMLTALVGFLFMTVYAILYLATGGKNGAYATENSPRILRAYAVFALGLVTSLLSYAFSANASAMHSLLFSVFYIGFIPLTFYTAYVHDKSGATSVLGIKMNATVKVLFALLIVYAVVFVLMLPMTFCFPLHAAAAKYCFGWTTFLNNGFYRI